MTTPPLIHAVAQNAKHEIEKTWQLVPGNKFFSGIQIQKRGDMYRIPGTCLPDLDMKAAAPLTVTALPDDMPKPLKNIVSLGIAIYKNNVSYANPIMINANNQIVIFSKSGGIANFYFPDIVWYADECQ